MSKQQIGKSFKLLNKEEKLAKKIGHLAKIQMFSNVPLLDSPSVQTFPLGLRGHYIKD